jgi:amino acid transporter
MEWLQWESAAATTSSSWNPLAGLISLLSVLLLSIGVQESKNVTNVFTILKVTLVVFMVVGGFWLWDSSHVTPFFIPVMGVAGTLRGATSSFFAYLGYDEVCCLASEAKNPKQDMPKAVLLTIAIVTGLYVLASLALVGMVDYSQISETSGFPAAFATRGVAWAAQIAAAGEVITLPVVCTVCIVLYCIA